MRDELCWRPPTAATEQLEVRGRQTVIYVSSLQPLVRAT
jgi:hypothetical protein